MLFVKWGGLPNYLYMGGLPKKAFSTFPLFDRCRLPTLHSEKVEGTRKVKLEKSQVKIRHNSFKIGLQVMNTKFISIH